MKTYAPFLELTRKQIATDPTSDDDWPEWAVTYEFDGAKWGVTFFARDEKEASRRLRAIGMTGVIDGQIIERVPVFPGAGIYVRLKVLWKNLTGATA